jgi:hypothetical protein
MVRDHEGRVPDRRLITLVGLAAVFSLGHTADHVARGDLPWPLTAAAVPFLLLNLTLYGVVGVGLYLYVRHTVGPRFWALVAGLGVVVGWLAHFSPWTDQPPRSILAAYPSAAAGWLALGCLIALMLALLTAATYAGALWMRQGP